MPYCFFLGHPSNFKVTRGKKSLILTRIGRFWTVTPVWINHSPTHLPSQVRYRVSLWAFGRKFTILKWQNTIFAKFKRSCIGQRASCLFTMALSVPDWSTNIISSRLLMASRWMGTLHAKCGDWYWLRLESINDWKDPRWMFIVTILSTHWPD